MSNKYNYCYKNNLGTYQHGKFQDNIFCGKNNIIGNLKNHVAGFDPSVQRHCAILHNAANIDPTVTALI